MLGSTTQRTLDIACQGRRMLKYAETFNQGALEILGLYNGYVSIPIYIYTHIYIYVHFFVCTFIKVLRKRSLRGSL